MLADRRLAWLPSEKSNKEVRVSDADTSTQPMDRSQRPLWLNWGESWKKLRKRADPWEDQYS